MNQIGAENDVMALPTKFYGGKTEIVGIIYFFSENLRLRKRTTGTTVADVFSPFNALI